MPTPVDFDPFAQKPTPVDHDPFAKAPASPDYDPSIVMFGGTGGGFDPQASQSLVKGAGAAAKGLVGGVAGLLPNEWGGDWGRRISQQAEDDFKEASKADPVASRVGYWGLEAAPALLTKGRSLTTQGLSLGTRMIEGAQTGAVVGAGYGALSPSTQESYSKRLKEKGLDALVGGTLGGLLTGGLPLIGAAGGAIANYLATALGRKATKAELALVEKAKDLAEGKISDLSAEEKRLAQHMRDTMEQKGIVAGELDRVHPEDLVARQQAAKATGLPSPTTGDQIAAGTHVEGQLRPLAETALARAEAIQAAEGGKPFRKYLEVANKKQAIQPFGLSPEGKALEGELENIIQGGSKDLKNVSADEAATAKRLLDALYPKSAGPVPNIDPELAAQLQAFGALPKSEAGRQVDFSLVERELRHLRDLQQKKAIEAFTGVQRAETKGIADRLENAMKAWVGKDNYARPDYAAASKEYNLWKTQFGEKLTGKQEIPYSLEGGVYVAPESQLGQHVFRDKDTVGFAQRLMGEAQVNSLAEQHAVDQLKGLKGEAARDWLDSSKNTFIDAVPGLRGKLSSYVQKIERHEVGGATLKRVKETALSELKDLDASVSALSSQIGEIGGRSKTLQAGVDAIEAAGKIAAKDKALGSKAVQEAASQLVGKLKNELTLDQFAQAKLLVDKLEAAIAKRNKARVVVGGTAAGAASALGGGALFGYAARNTASSMLGDR